MLLGKDNQVHTIDLGLVHSSSAESLVQFIVNQLRQVDEILSGISPSFLVRNWSPGFKEWSTRAIRDAFYASPVFPRLLNADAIRQTVVRGVQDGLLAYVGKGRDGKYVPFMFERSIDPSDVEISDETFNRDTRNGYCVPRGAVQACGDRASRCRERSGWYAWSCRAWFGGPATPGWL